MRDWLWLAILPGALWAAGCARDRNAAPTTGEIAANPAPVASTNGSSSQLIVTALEGLNGKVSAADVNLRFVVLTFPVGQMPALNQQLNIYRDGLKVGIVNVSGPQRDDSIVADIIMGEAHTGDQVRDR
jgi:hypothetical protein